MSKGINADSQVHISIAFLIKAMVAISMMIAAYYQIQMKFASMDRSIGDMHEELVVLTSKMHDMEKQHLEELEHHNEELVEENKSLLEKMGLKKR
jgi:phage host-nuclease inhibitor protein Gam